MSQTTFDRWVSGVQKVGLPAVICLLLLWKGSGWVDTLADGAVAYMRVQAETSKTQAEAMGELADAYKVMANNQTEMLAIMKSLDRRVGRVESNVGTSG